MNMMISLIVWLVLISVIFTFYGKVAERFSGFTTRSAYLVLTLGVVGAGVYLLCLWLLTLLLPTRYFFSAYIILCSAASIIIRYITMLLYSNRRKGLNRFQLVTVSVIVGLGFLLVENYIIIIITNKYLLSQELMLVPSFLFTSVVMGYYHYDSLQALGRRSGYFLIRGAAIAIVYNTIFNYLMILGPGYVGTTVYISIMAAAIASALFFCVLLSVRAYRSVVSER